MSSSPRSSSPYSLSTSGRTAAQVEQDGRDALQDNLDDYEAIAGYSGAEFSISRVNDYEQKYTRLQSVKQCEQQLLKSNTAADKILQRIRDLESLSHIQEIMTDLEQNSDDVDAACFAEISKLLALPMIAAKLKAWIHREADLEKNDRHEKMRRMRDIVQGLKMTERQRAIDRSEKEIEEFQITVTTLESQLKQSEKFNNELSNKIGDLKLELGQRSSATDEEVNGLRFRLSIVENDKTVALEKIEERRQAQLKSDKELEELKRSIHAKDEIIRKKELDIDEARAQTTRQVQIYDKLKEDRFVEQGEQTATSARLQLEQKQNENLTRRNKEVQDMYEQTRSELRKLQVDSQVGIDTLRIEKTALEQDKTVHLTQIQQLQKDLTTHKTLLADSKAGLKQLTEQNKTLAQDSETTRVQAITDVEKLRSTMREDIYKLEILLEKERTSVTTLGDQLEALKVQHEEESMDMEDKLTEATDNLNDERINNDRLSTMLRDDGAELDRIRFDNSAQNDKISRLSARIEELEDIVAQHEEAEPDIREEINLLKAQVQRREATLQNMRDALTTRDQEIQAVNRILVSYAFHGEVKLNYMITEHQLNSTPKVSKETVHQALKQIEPSVINIETTHCLSGFQIWAEANTNPTTFTLPRIIAYLRGPGDFNDIGFLWLAAEAVVQSANTPEVILAIYNVIHLWMRLDPMRFLSMAEFSKKVHNKFPTVWWLEERMVYWFYTNIMWRFINDLVDSKMPSIKTIGRYMSYSYHRKEEFCLTLAEDKHIIHLNPIYIYVHNERVVWLQPGQITFEIDLPNQCFYIHDALTPHQIDRHAVPFVDMERVCNVIEDVTYIK